MRPNGCGYEQKALVAQSSRPPVDGCDLQVPANAARANNAA